MSASIANLAREGATLDDVQGDIGNLYDLLDVLFDAVTDFEIPAEMQGSKERVTSLIWIARDIAKRAKDEMDANAATIAKASNILRGVAR